MNKEFTVDLYHVQCEYIYNDQDSKKSFTYIQLGKNDQLGVRQAIYMMEVYQCINSLCNTLESLKNKGKT